MGETERSLECFARALTLKPDYAQACNNQAGALKDSGRLEEAAEFCERALALNPEFAAAHCNHGSVLLERGKLIDAIAAFEQALRLKPGYPEAIYNLALVRTCRRGDAILAELESLANRSELIPEIKRPFIHFALAKALEETGDHARAFEQLLQGNKIKRRQVSYDQAATIDEFRQIKEVFNADFIRQCAGGGDLTTTPIFILGMPRSGSTLIEQIMSSHPSVHGAGELKLLSVVANRLGPYPSSLSALDARNLRQMGDDYLSALPPLPDGKTRITDKMPGNFLYVGLIHLMFPNARIIHTIRDPVDTCVSCFSKLFATAATYSYDLSELGRYYRCYADLMDHWRSVLPSGTMLDVSYEQVVDDLEGQARRMLQYCGLPWDDRCLNFHKNDRPVSTASNVTVRQPLYRTAVQRWRKYESQIQVLLEELKK